MSSADNKRVSEEYNRQLEWIRFREDTLGEAAYQETPGGKLSRKMKENPFVPIGATATIMALGYGLWCFRTGRVQQSQNMMRARIGAQGLTIFAILAGLMLGAGSDKGVKRDAKPS